ncbi:hypothetical protein OS242_04385 [Tumebacillus sp. DT12]|uniref:DUF86 domain-containing protein n=1 Tax=Tumebacillus lacus TaxID=2995335 RepID=A0ABT3WWX7_9BACL|nr:hypothetical protein [Tumebacillus lacus]MCX7569188.1 hypothetical protein [Tumebacillus lacus]
MSTEIKNQLLLQLKKGITMLEEYIRIEPDGTLEDVLKRYRKAEERIQTKAISELTRLDLPVSNIMRMVADGSSGAIHGWDDPIFDVLSEVSSLVEQLLKEAERK